nr:hypothetical protein CFP56_43569 [Quercus suber]
MSTDASEKKKLSDKIIWLARYLDNEAKQFKHYVINVGTYHENVPYNITTDDACDDANDNHAWARVNEEGTIYDTLLISEDELFEQDFIDDEELSDDIYESNDDESDDDESSDDES